MPRLILIMLLSLLAACSAQPGRQIQFPDQPRNRVDLHVFLYDDLAQLNRVYREQYGGVRHVPSFAHWRGEYCEIHVMRINTGNWRDESYWRGHEVTHCTDGAWHSE